MNKKYTKAESHNNIGISWSLEELKALVEDKNSHVHLIKTTRHVSLLPWYTNDVPKSLHEILGSEINQYNHEWKGFLLAYKNPKMMSTMGAILYDAPFIHADVEADFYVFKPDIGCKIKGIINKKGGNHIGVLVHKAFNVSIPKRDDDEDEWQGNNWNAGEAVIFTVINMDFKGRLPFIRGKLVPQEEQSEDIELVSNKSNKIIFSDEDVQSEMEVSSNDLVNISNIEPKAPKFSSTVNETSDLESEEETNKLHKISKVKTTQNIKKASDDSSESDDADETFKLTSTVINNKNTQSPVASSDSEDEKQMVNKSSIKLNNQRPVKSTKSISNDSDNDEPLFNVPNKISTKKVKEEQKQSDDSDDDHLPLFNKPIKGESRKKSPQKSSFLLNANDSSEEEQILEVSSKSKKKLKTSKKRKLVDLENNKCSEEIPVKMKKKRKISEELPNDQSEHEAAEMNLHKESKIKINYNNAASKIFTSQIESKPRIIHEEMLNNVNTKVEIGRKNVNLQKGKILESAHTISNNEGDNEKSQSIKTTLQLNSKMNSNLQDLSLKNNSQNNGNEKSFSSTIKSNNGNKHGNENKNEGKNNSSKLDEENKNRETDDSDEDLANLMVVKKKKIKNSTDVRESIESSTEKETNKSTPVKKKSKKHSESTENQILSLKATSNDDSMGTDKVENEKDKVKKREEKDKVKKKKSQKLDVQVVESMSINALAKPIRRGKDKPIIAQSSKVLNLAVESDSDSEEETPQLPTINLEDVAVPKKEEKSTKKSMSKKKFQETENTSEINGTEVEVKKEKKSKKKSKKNREEAEALNEEILNCKEIKNEEISKKKKSKQSDKKNDDFFATADSPVAKKRESRMSSDSDDLGDSSISKSKLLTGNIKIKSEPVFDAENGSSRKRKAVDATNIFIENMSIKHELSVVKSEPNGKLTNSIKTENDAPPKKKAKTMFNE